MLVTRLPITGFVISERLTTPYWCNEAESSSRFRIRAPEPRGVSPSIRPVVACTTSEDVRGLGVPPPLLPHGGNRLASRFGLPLLHVEPPLYGERAITIVDSFQSTRDARLPWRTERHERKPKVFTLRELRKSEVCVPVTQGNRGHAGLSD